MSPRREALPDEEARFEAALERESPDPPKNADDGDDLDDYAEDAAADDRDNAEVEKTAAVAREVDHREMDATRLYLSEIGRSSSARPRFM